MVTACLAIEKNLVLPCDIFTDTLHCITMEDVSSEPVSYYTNIGPAISELVLRT